MVVRQFDTDIRWRDAWRVAKQVLSRWVGPGHAVSEFEQRVADLCGVNHCIATTSGTVALMLCLCDLEPGTPVSFPAYGMPAGMNAARFLGLKVQLVDSNGDDTPVGNDPSICLHNNGFPQSFNKNTVVHDCCQSLGVQLPLSNCLPATLSFSPQKIITTGQGGAVLTNDAGYAECLRGRINHGRNGACPGANFRMTDIQAALGLSQLKRIQWILDKRSLLVELYSQHIDIGFDFGWQAVALHYDGTDLVNHLKSRGVEASLLYPPNADGFPLAQRAFETRVYLPSHLRLTELEVEYVCKCIKEFG